MSNTNDNRNARREFLLAGAAATLGLAYRRIPSIAAASTVINRGGPPDPPATHGMLLFGEKSVYLSHLPMFSMTVHRYQVILEATLTKTGSDPQAAYVQDRRRHPSTKIYSFEPEAFVLPELDPKNPQRTSFKGTIFRGHFERGGSPINENVIATVARVIHFRKFDSQAASLPQLEYFIFGKGQDLFLAHLITSPPDFDQVLSVQEVDKKFVGDELNNGAPIIFPGRKNTPGQRIKAAQLITGQLKGAAGGAAQTVRLRPGVQFYFESGELASA